MTNTIERPSTTEATSSHTKRWLRLARGAAITIFAWMVLLSVLAADVIPPVVVIGIIALAFAVLLKDERRKTGLGFGAFAALAVLGNVRGVIDELSNLDSTPAFVLTLLLVLGAGLGLISGLGAFFGWSSTPITHLVRGAGAVLVVLGVTSLLIGGLADSAEQLAADVPVTLEGLAYEPETVIVDRSGSVWVDNRDGIRHTFTVEALDLDLEVPALKARRIAVDGPAGTYQVICTVPGHESMTATLVIGG